MPLFKYLKKLKARTYIADIRSVNPVEKPHTTDIYLKGNDRGSISRKAEDIPKHMQSYLTDYERRSAGLYESHPFYNELLPLEDCFTEDKDPFDLRQHFTFIFERISGSQFKVTITESFVNENNDTVAVIQHTENVLHKKEHEVDTFSVSYDGPVSITVNDDINNECPGLRASQDKWTTTRNVFIGLFVIAVVLAVAGLFPPLPVTVVAVGAGLGIISVIAILVTSLMADGKKPEIVAKFPVADPHDLHAPMHVELSDMSPQASARNLFARTPTTTASSSPRDVSRNDDDDVDEKDDRQGSGMRQQ